MEAATDGMGDAEKAAALQSTFTADSIKGLNLMLNAGSGELSTFRDDLYGCGLAIMAMAAEVVSTSMPAALQFAAQFLKACPRPSTVVLAFAWA